jgi:hypothetical protein
MIGDIRPSPVAQSCHTATAALSRYRNSGDWRATFAGRGVTGGQGSSRGQAHKAADPRQLGRGRYWRVAPLGILENSERASRLEFWSHLRLAPLPPGSPVDFAPPVLESPLPLRRDEIGGTFATDHRYPLGN